MLSSRVISDFRASSASRVQQAPRKVFSTSIERSQSKPARRQIRSRVLMRQLVRVQKDVGRSSRKRAGFKGIALTVLASVLFVFGIGVGVLQLHTNQKVKAQVQTLAAQAENADTGSDTAGTVAVPSEEKPSSPAAYHVAPDIPRTLSIPKLGINARVLRLGVKTNGEIKTPSNIYDAGWYDGSAKPGEPGALFIDGHVHGPTLPGVFVGLKKLVAGDKITLRRGDGQVFSYHVVKSQSYDKDNVDMGAAFNSVVPGRPELNLITCYGSYDKSGEYNNRLIVFAVQD